VAGIQARILRQSLVEFLHSVRIQPRGSASAGLGSQPLVAFSPDCRSPTPHTAPIHTH
jgi:hypothetical protein